MKKSNKSSEKIKSYGPEARKISDTNGLLKEIVNCLNQLLNMQVSNMFFKSTYEICSEIDKHIK